MRSLLSHALRDGPAFSIWAYSLTYMHSSMCMWGGALGIWGARQAAPLAPLRGRPCLEDVFHINHCVTCALCVVYFCCKLLFITRLGSNCAIMLLVRKKLTPLGEEFHNFFIKKN